MLLLAQTDWMAIGGSLVPAEAPAEAPEARVRRVPLGACDERLELHTLGLEPNGGDPTALSVAYSKAPYWGGLGGARGGLWTFKHHLELAVDGTTGRLTDGNCTRAAAEEVLRQRLSAPPPGGTAGRHLFGEAPPSAHARVSVRATFDADRQLHDEWWFMSNAREPRMPDHATLQPLPEGPALPPDGARVPAGDDEERWRRGPGSVVVLPTEEAQREAAAAYGGDGVKLHCADGRTLLFPASALHPRAAPDSILGERVGGHWPGGEEGWRAVLRLDDVGAAEAAPVVWYLTTGRAVRPRGWSEASWLRCHSAAAPLGCAGFLKVWQRSLDIERLVFRDIELSPLRMYVRLMEVADAVEAVTGEACSALRAGLAQERAKASGLPLEGDATPEKLAALGREYLAVPRAAAVHLLWRAAQSIPMVALWCQLAAALGGVFQEGQAACVVADPAAAGDYAAALQKMCWSGKAGRKEARKVRARREPAGVLRRAWEDRRNVRAFVHVARELGVIGSWAP